jgi:hypothetical protein
MVGNNNKLPDFAIQPFGPVATTFLALNIFSFKEAMAYIRKMPYGRNANKDDLTTIFKEGRGTCSTKHAVLKVLSDEHQFYEPKLMIGIFKMNPINTPGVAHTLSKNNLDYLPEAHCYLRFDEEIIDVTKMHSSPKDFIDDLLEEVEITADQISAYKVDYHKRYLEDWLAQQGGEMTLDKLWSVREQCISDLFD